jgi:hypothetical protein
VKANAQPLSEILFSNTQFIVPFFQRSYSWDRPNWERLVGDIENLQGDEVAKKHFLGPLVCSLLGATPGKTPQYQLIDGQQRLTTLSLLLLAIRDTAKELDCLDLAAEILETYLIHRFKNGFDRYKLVPRTGDRELFWSFIEEKKLPQNATGRLISGYTFFRKYVQLHAQKKSDYLRWLFDIVVNRLFLVVITLEGEDPYEIFESLNSTGLPLQESDLIRNFLFMKIPFANQGSFQDETWAPFEAEFEGVDRSNLAPTPFFRDFLMRKGTYSKAKETFVDFKQFYNLGSYTPASVVEELHRFVRYAQAIATGGNKQPKPVENVLRQFAAMDASTANPVLLNLLDAMDRQVLSESEFVNCVNDINGFLIRRSICSENSRSYVKWFCELAGQLGDKEPRKQIQAYLLHRGWPDDDSFKRQLIEFPLYNREQKKCRIILESLERVDGFKEIVIIDKNIQIEHVMPQSLPKGAAGVEWRRMLGEDSLRTHRRWIHTLGNLTLTAYNPMLSNRAYSEKRNEFAISKFSLNKHFASIDCWNETKIKSRAEKLADQVAMIWPRPSTEIPYIPPSKKEGRENKSRDRLRAYWETFTLGLGQSGISLRSVRQSEGSAFQFYLPMADVSLVAQFVRPRNQITVRLTFARDRGNELFLKLKKEQNSIDEQSSISLEWQAGEKPTVSAVMPGVSIRDPLDWREQHEWILKAVQNIEVLVIPRLREFSEVVKEKSESKQFFLDYWVAFHALLFERKSKLFATTPLPQHWNNFTIGRSGIWMDAIINRTASTVSVVIIMGSKYSRAFFPQLVKEKQQIEEELVYPVDWHNDQSKKQWKIEKVSKEFHVTDPANWKDQHEWLIDTLEKFESVFRPRAQKLTKK